MIAESLLPEFDHEMGTTRKYLDRLPEAHASFKPHEKSMGLAQLASHIAEMVGWVVPTLNADELDIAGYQPKVVTTRADLLRMFDENVVAARAAIEQMEDRDWNKPWALKMGGHTAFTMPKIGVVRSMILNHIIHHRGQLSVYYREVGVPVPATYGPSADER
jgi:uncharacterized damage-inducible protein DinB